MAWPFLVGGVICLGMNQTERLFYVRRNSLIRKTRDIVKLTGNSLMKDKKKILATKGFSTFAKSGLAYFQQSKVW
jgi:hypothetical protein